jgi:SAM-dependent methyltransferase
MSTPEAPVTSASRVAIANAWIEVHHAVCREEFEGMLRSVGIRPGWRVLDAGCGTGNYLPLLAELVGPTGALDALDLVPETVAITEARVSTQPLACSVKPRVGELTALPYPDDTFDAVWCADTTQHLSDEQLAVALVEFRRVVKPGGLVAVKDIDLTMLRNSCISPLILGRLLVSGYMAGGVEGRSSWRGPELRGALLTAGLRDVWQRTTLVERFAPLDGATRRFMVAAVGAYAARVAQQELSADDQAAWARLTQDAAGEVDRPTFFYREGNILAVGRVPEIS